MGSKDLRPSTELVLDALLAEFSATRDEILATINMQYTILSLGTGLLAALFGVALSQGSNPSSVYLLFLVPFVSVAISSLWAVEGIRRLRASSYVRDEIAPKVNAIYQADLRDTLVSDGRLLGYETFLREASSPQLTSWNNTYYRLTQAGVLGVFLGSGLAAWGLALYLIVIPHLASLPAIASIGIVVLVIELLAMLYVGKLVSSVVEAARTLIAG